MFVLPVLKFLEDSIGRCSDAKLENVAHKRLVFFVQNALKLDYSNCNFEKFPVVRASGTRDARKQK